MTKVTRSSAIIAAAVIFWCGVNGNAAAAAGDTGAVPGMRHIPGGTFLMGQPNPDVGSAGEAQHEQPVHKVTVSPFYMDTANVTQGNYEWFMGINPSFFSGDFQRPVEQVTWFDAVLYCNARSRRGGRDTVYSYSSVQRDSLWCIGMTNVAADFSKNGYRLPTEAEWEYACRAGKSTDYSWGRNFPLKTLADTLAMDSNAVWCHNSSNSTQPVGIKRPNAFGVYDMNGNILQWCNDWFGDYDSGAQIDPAGPETGSKRVLRGGSWIVYSRFCRCSHRGGFAPSFYSNIHGFRCVRR